MSRTTLEVAAIFRRHGKDFRQTHRPSAQQQRVMRAIELCRTSSLGGHVEQCGQCQYARIAYNSCRNRHCPKCQSRERSQWLLDRQADLLPVPYFHLVFTLPPQIAAIALQNPRVLYGLLFRISAETLLTIARDPRHPGAEIGFFSVLHTWGQNLLFHPHIHCVATGGGIPPDSDRFIQTKPGFFLPVRVLSALFRRLFLEALLEAHRDGLLRFHGELAALANPERFAAYLEPFRHSAWIVYAKPPFGGPRQVLAYLARYTHRVAIANERLTAHADGQVTFRWKDYRLKNRHKKKMMTLEAHEFIRRFLLHTLPPGLQRIRHYGFLANCHRRAKLQLCRELLETELQALLPAEAAREASSILVGAERPLPRCPHCGVGGMVWVGVFAPFPSDSS